MSNGVAEGLANEAACLTAQVILSVHPGEELVNERCEHGLSILEASRRRQFAPGLIELVQLAHAQEPLATDGEAGDGGFPKASASMRPTGHFAGRRVAIFDGVTAEERVVDGVGVGLDVAGETAEHLAHGGAGVLGLKLEKHVLLVGQNDKEMAFAAGLPPPVWKWLRAERDSGGIGRKAEGMLTSVVDASEHDGAEASSDVFGRACHGTTIELDAVG